MALNPSLLEFVGRYKTVEANRKQEVDLIKELLIYTENVERTLRAENKTLEGRLNDTYLDLEDARKSRRELQQQMLMAGQTLDKWKVRIPEQELSLDQMSRVCSGIGS